MEELLENQGLPVYLEIKNGLLSKATLAIDNFDINHEPRLIWRLVPRLSCEFSLINTIAKPALSAVGQKIVLQFDDFKIVVEVPDSGDGGTAKDLYAVLSDFHRKSAHFKNLDKDYNLQKSPTQQSSHYQQKVSLKEALFQATSKEETLLQLCTQLRFQEGLMIIDKIGVSVRERMVRSGMDQWIRFVKEKNDVKMRMDRGRWRLHASANQDIDLQAWYHALFYQEVYRLRGHFWYKDAMLPIYKQSYDLVDNALTPLEEAALAHVLCSPDTSYGDVAGQMFVVQALISPDQFQLFQQLAAQGSQVVKYPRSGRPAKKLFRFSFVEGNIYLTWKGKFGNQGVGMAEVTSVLGGIQTDVLKWSGQASKAEQYLSVVCSDRSVDLFFDNEYDRNNWRDLLTALVAKEHGELEGIEPVDPPDEAGEYEWMLLYASIGKRSQYT